MIITHEYNLLQGTARTAVGLERLERLVGGIQEVEELALGRRHVVFVLLRAASGAGPDDFIVNDATKAPPATAADISSSRRVFTRDRADSTSCSGLLDM